MSVDPKEAQAFANILGKIDGVQQGTEIVDVNAGRAKRMADNDMTSILSAFASTSGTPSALTLTPEALTESADKSDQVGAEFEPETISPVLGEPEKDHPMAGMLVGEAEEVEEEVVEEVVEAVANEDSLSDIKKRLTDYLQDIKTAKPVDDKELSKKNDEDKLGPAIKTIKTDDGKEIKIHGNEDDGFRLKVNEKVHSAKFKSFDEAQMACEAYVAKRKTAMENQDYVEEK